MPASSRRRRGQQALLIPPPSSPVTRRTPVRWPRATRAPSRRRSGKHRLERCVPPPGARSSTSSPPTFSAGLVARESRNRPSRRPNVGGTSKQNAGADSVTSYVFSQIGWGLGVAMYFLFGIAAAASGWMIWTVFMGLDSLRYPMLSFGDQFYRVYGPFWRHFINVGQAIQQFMLVSYVFPMQSFRSRWDSFPLPQSRLKVDMILRHVVVNCILQGHHPRKRLLHCSIQPCHLLRGLHAYFHARRPRSRLSQISPTLRMALQPVRMVKCRRLPHRHDCCGELWDRLQLHHQLYSYQHYWADQDFCWTAP